MESFYKAHQSKKIYIIDINLINTLKKRALPILLFNFKTERGNVQVTCLKK